MRDTTSHRPLISADSHVIEPISIWEGLLPDGFWANETAIFSKRPGGSDPHARGDAMEMDGVAAEVLYPSVAMRLFSLDDPGLQQQCFRRYNQWLAEYCAVDPDRLIGVGLIPAWDMDAALREVTWCKANGMRSVQVWQTPPTELPFSSNHYEPLWEAAATTGLPVSIHILTGFGYILDTYKLGPKLLEMGIPAYRQAVIQKLTAMQDSLLDIIFSGVLDRHRELRLLLVESECGWLPFFVDQCDLYHERYDGRTPITLERRPSEAMRDQVFATFIDDPSVELVAQRMGTSNLMWSSDYPHNASSWPNSQKVVADQFLHTPEESVHRIVWETACEVFGIDLSITT